MADVNRISRAVRVLATGRAPGVAIAFAIPLVLARVFDQAEFGIRRPPGAMNTCGTLPVTA